MFKTHVGSRLLAALALVVATLALVAAGCGGDDSGSGSGSSTSSGEGASTSPSEVSGTIRFLGHTAIQAPMTAIIKNFENAHPDVKVDAQFVPNGAPWLQALTTQLRGGNAPDVFYTSGGEASAGSVSLVPLAKAGKVADLGSPAWAEAIPEPARNLFYVDDKLYGLPLFQAPIGVIYNVNEFEKLGLKPPTTWAEMLQACSKVKAAGKVPISLPGQAGVMPPLSIAGSTVYAEEPDWNEKRAAGDVTFADSSGWQTAMERVVEMNDKDCFQPGAAGASVPVALQVVASGQALMLVGPADAIGAIAGQAKGAKFAAFPMPGDTVESTRAMVSYSPAAAISTSTKNEAAAKAFLEFVGSPEQAAQFAEVSGTVSLQQAKDGELPPALDAFAPFLQEGKTTPYSPDGWVTGGPLNTAMTPAMAGLLTGQKTPEDVLEDMDAQWGK